MEMLVSLPHRNRSNPPALKHPVNLSQTHILLPPSILLSEKLYTRTESPYARFLRLGRAKVKAYGFSQTKYERPCDSDISVKQIRIARSHLIAYRILIHGHDADYCSSSSNFFRIACSSFNCSGLRLKNSNTASMHVIESQLRWCSIPSTSS